MPLMSDAQGWYWVSASTPSEYFASALQWRSLHDTYPGWWTQGAGEIAYECMDAAMAGAGLA